MRAASLFLPAALLVSGCVPADPVRSIAAPPVAPVTERSPVVSPAVLEASPAAPSPEPSSVTSPTVTRREIAGITFEGISFDSESHRLRVIDQPGGPGSRFSDARSAAASVNGIAGSNAGFFTPEGAPLGKLISSGKPAGSWNASSLGAGVFFETLSGHLAIARRESVSRTTAQRELLQAGPMLVDNGRAVSGLENTKPAIRIVLLWDGGSRWWLGRSSPCTLAAISSALAGGSPAPWKIRQALNLDGGRSSDLWISGRIPGGPVDFQSLFRRPVRNFLIVAPR